MPTVSEIKEKYNTGDNLNGEKIKNLIDDIASIIPKGTENGILTGEGQPNNRQTAPPGTLYHDRTRVMGASIWVKTEGTGATGWEVVVGNTGQREIPVKNNNGAKVFMQRVGNVVTVTFGGGTYGWFSLNETKVKSDGWAVAQKGPDLWLKLTPDGPNNRNEFIPLGFRSKAPLTVGVYDDNSKLIGSMYYGGDADSNALQLRFPNMTKDKLTDKFLKELRPGFFTYLTNESWPTDFRIN